MRLAGALALALLVCTTSAGATTIARVTLPEMERTATVVFVGEFTHADRVRLGGSEPGRRYVFRVERFLRGGPAKTVNLTMIDFADLWLGVTHGTRYLVFAQRLPLGARREERLVPSGYYQGVYRMLGQQRATNRWNGVVTLSHLGARLRDR